MAHRLWVPSILACLFPMRKVGRPESERSHGMKMNGIDRNGTVV